jgi:hypothetical protein
MPRSNLTAAVVGELGISISTFVFSRTALEWLELDPAAIQAKLQLMQSQLPQGS